MGREKDPLQKSDEHNARGIELVSTRVVEASERRATVDGSLESEGAVCATSRATFVAVGPGHPAHGRW